MRGEEASGVRPLWGEEHTNYPFTATVNNAGGFIG